MNDFDITFVTAFLQGILSFFSPCVLPLLPVYFGYLSGEDYTNRKKSIVNSLLFAVGIGFAFFILGLGATSLGQVFARYRSEFSIVGGILIILLAFVQLSIFGKFLMREKRLPINVTKLRLSPITAILMGFVFSFAWTPCIGPALAGILIMAGQAESRSSGMFYIALYTLGFAVPFIITGFFVSSILAFFKKHRAIVKWTGRLGGILLLLVGIYMVYLGVISIIDMNRIEEEQTNELVKGKNGEIIDVASKGQTSQKEKEYVPAPDFKLSDQYGNIWNLQDLKGKSIILNFWATWCPPCRAEMPDFQKVYEELKAQGNDKVIILGVASPGGNRDKSRAEVEKFLKDNGYSYPILMDESGKVVRDYYISAYPTTYLINSEGKVVDYVIGMLNEQSLRHIVDLGMQN
ncbi:cytochrome c biogenesis protein/redoxin [Treponema pectinovorum]|uniref:cytochrome c biogenesis protein/redoxin n=1 Tax=Treponema pectinovorum TaxID=164 RepID=UPI0011CA7242|nr:cytochrome c biogenesis protein/redoxin [Treponema pectinovorum]